MFNAIKKIFLHLIYKHKLLFATLVIVQIVSILAALFVCSFLISSTQIEKEYDYTKTFKITLDNQVSNENLKEYIYDFMKRNDIPLKSLQVIDDEKNISFDFIYNSEHALYGRYFLKDEFEFYDDVIIVSKNISPEIIDGDKYVINGKEYNVVGTNYEFSHILPKSAYDTTIHNNSIITFLLERYPTDIEYNNIATLAKEIFKTDSIELPMRVEDSNSLLNNSTTIILLCLVIISIVNVAFVYRYIIEQNKKLIHIFRLVGATKIKCAIILVSVIIVLAVVSFTIGCIISALILPQIIRFINFDNFRYMLKITDYLSISILFIVVVLFTTYPVIKKFVKSVNISECKFRR